MPLITLVVALLALPVGGGPASGRQIPEISVRPAVYRSATPKASASAADLVLATSRLPASAYHDLGPLTEDERARLESRRGDPARRDVHVVGVVRSLRASPAGLVEAGEGGWTSWTAAFRSAGARGVRLHVTMELPRESRAYVYSAGGQQVQGPYHSHTWSRPGGFWTNTVFAEEIFLEVQSPASLADARIHVDSVAHLDGDRAVAALAEACPLDVSCVAPSEFPSLDEASRAVAIIFGADLRSLEFWQCSAALVNTAAGPIAPYLLTAAHCAGDLDDAVSMEAFWGYRAPACGGPAPDLATLPRSLGGTLLASSTMWDGTDFALIRLAETPPDGSVFLGWTTGRMTDGTTLHRISHPEGLVQSYSRNSVAEGGVCGGRGGQLVGERGLRTRIVRGATRGGSSGSVLLTDRLEIVGQLTLGCASCLQAPGEGRDLDGAFRLTFPAVAQYLIPTFPVPCVPDGATLCLNGGRFRVATNYLTAAGQSGAGMAVSLTSDSGYFWFFNSANIELVVKVLDACGLNPPHFWVFAGGLTNIQVTLDVLDMQTGAEKTYVNPLGTAFAPIQDTSAFSCP